MEMEPKQEYNLISFLELLLQNVLKCDSTQPRLTITHIRDRVKQYISSMRSSGVATGGAGGTIAPPWLHPGIVKV